MFKKYLHKWTILDNSTDCTGKSLDKHRVFFDYANIIYQQLLLLSVTVQRLCGHKLNILDVCQVTTLRSNQYIGARRGTHKPQVTTTTTPSQHYKNIKWLDLQGGFCWGAVFPTNRGGSGGGSSQGSGEEDRGTGDGTSREVAEHYLLWLSRESNDARRLN